MRDFPNWFLDFLAHCHQLAGSEAATPLIAALLPAAFVWPTSQDERRLCAHALAAAVLEGLFRLTQQPESPQPVDNRLLVALGDERSPECRLKGYLDAQYAQPLSLAPLARRFGCSRATLARAFKARYGVSPHEYMTLMRLQRAADSIAGTPDKIDSIATMVGYRSRKHFYRLFRAQYGCTPSTFRRRQLHQGTSTES